MTAEYTIEHYSKEISSHRRKVLIEKFFITLLIFIGICGFTVVTLEANTPSPTGMSGLQVAADQDAA